MAALAAVVAACTGSAATQPAASASAVTSTPATASAVPALTPASTAIASPSPQPSIPGQVSPTAAITIHELVLDPTTDSAAKARTFTFVSDGPGHVSVQVVAATTVSSTRLCLAADSGTPECRTGVAPAFPDQVTAAAHATWSVTLTSADESTPTVDLAISWPSEAPSVTLTGGRFQGAPNPDALRSFSASFTPRAAGQMGLTASWTPGPAVAGLTLVQEPTASNSTVDQASYPSSSALSPAYTHAVAKGVTYRITLMNTSADAGRTSLTAKISFP